MTDVLTVDKWDAGQVKNVLDETAKQVFLQALHFEESNLLVDIRLFLCALPVASAFYALIYDLLYPFPESAQVLKICVYGYIVMMIVLTLYSTFIESNTILVGYKKRKGIKKDKIKLISKMKRFDEMYTLTLEKEPNSSASFTKSVGNYFDVNGTFLDAKFQRDVRALHKTKST